ncbi:MAG: D-aminoacyl-tRNA deacylase [Oscillospiraceae bacterium]|nr:D-aminoacyl-tRNA deacylase [Oscillospiraceae bacterium]
MKVVLQRVKSAKVEVENNVTGEIKKGFMLLLGVEENDTEKDADALALKISGLRIFTDENDKMNLSLADVNGQVLVVSNFTLCADCSHGRRPSFISAARPDTANPLYEYFCSKLLQNGVSKVEKGIFGADMLVTIENDGPVTLILNSKELIK